MFARTINQDWKVTIPIELRRKMGIKPGQQVFFDEESDELVIGLSPDKIKSIKRFEPKL